jgi:hypothetical protein
MRDDKVVDRTKSENITVTWRRSVESPRYYSVARRASHALPSQQYLGSMIGLIYW